MNEARAPDKNDLRDKVLSEYRKGKKPKELSDKYGVSYNTVKSWIAREKKKLAEEQKTTSARKKGASSNRKRGAPLGNKNAVGKGAPLRNRNAVTHGAYAAIYWDSLDEDEQDLIDAIDDNEEEELITQIKMYTVRERRLMTYIKKYRELDQKNHGLAIKAVDKKKKIEDLVDSEGESLRDGKLKRETTDTVTKTEAVMVSIVALEAELTKVQRAKTKAIEALARIRLLREKQELEAHKDAREADLHDLNKELLDAQIEHMDAQTDKLLGTNVDLEDTSETDDLIYNHSHEEDGDPDED